MHGPNLSEWALRHQSFILFLIIALAAAIDGKASVVLLFDDTVTAEKGLDASALMKQKIAPLIKGGGGGQKTLATAGGQNISSLPEVIAAVKTAL